MVHGFERDFGGAPAGASREVFDSYTKQVVTVMPTNETVARAGEVDTTTVLGPSWKVAHATLGSVSVVEETVAPTAMEGVQTSLNGVPPEQTGTPRWG